MLLTVTLNPCIDMLYKTPAFALGETNRVRQVRRTAGGKGLNVARAACLLGQPALALGITGGWNGKHFQSLITEPGITPRFTQTQAETRCCIQLDTGSGRITELLEPGAPVTDAVLEEFWQSYTAALPQCSLVVLSGSVPPGTPEDFYVRMITAAKQAGKKVFLDTGGAMLAASLAAAPHFIKPNRAELCHLLGLREATQSALQAAALQLHKSGIETVAVSLGSQGALLACAEGVFFAQAPKIEAVNTVGCGDSMVAAFAVAALRGSSAAEALRFAVAVSAANAVTPQPGSFRQQDFDAFLPGINVTAL